jgi:hypothetical protein
MRLVIDDLAGRGVGAEALFRYILLTNPAAPRDMLRGLLPGDRGAEVEDAVTSWYEREMDRVRSDERREGERRVLLKQLRLRFGELPELEVWIERFAAA